MSLIFLYSRFASPFLFYFILGTSFILLIFYLALLHSKKQLNKKLIEKSDNYLRVSKNLFAVKDMLRIAEINQKEINQKLKTKTLNLAKISKENIDKDRTMNQLKVKVIEIERNLSKPVFIKTRIAEVRRLLNTTFINGDHTFEMQIDEINNDFYKELLKKFPSLTNYDLRLCAYLKMGLNTKEIAEIVNVLPSSINVSRSRLRKKLDLQPSEDLFKLLLKFED